MAMNRLNLNYSLKNIPDPSKLQYETELVNKVKTFVKKLDWDLFFKVHPTDTNNPTPNSFGFKSNKGVPYFNELNKLKPFKDALYDLISNIKYRPTTNEFQKGLKEDCKKIRNSNEIIVSADKSSNLYKMPVDDYKHHLLNNITKDYKRADRGDVLRTNKEAAKIAEKLKVEEKAEILSDSPAFVTIKDHKDDFPGRIKCRLINPSKTQIGIISKNILEKVNKEIRLKSGSNQWQSTKEVLHWFNGLQNKNNLTFLQFDIESFYPSISEELLLKAINFAKQFTTLSQDDIEIILHSRKTFLFSSGEPYVKKENENFDVPMGGYDSAEISELVGLYILNGLEQIMPQQYTGLYRDDGLHATTLPGPQIERLRKKIIQHFKSLGLKISIDANIKTVNFLDVTLDLSSGLHKPYRKETNKPIYIDVSSCHPPNVIKQIPGMIENRLSRLSSNEQLFEAEKTMYDKALKDAGYKHTLKYKQPTQPQATNKTRKKKALWFNPPFNSRVKTNVGKEFLKLIDLHFPKNSELHKFYNRNTIKVSYSTMPNIGSLIQSHNKKVLGEGNFPKLKDCMCQQKGNCPLNDTCRTANIIYKAVVTLDADKSEHAYIGLTAQEFKTRFHQHTHQIEHREAKGTSLSEFIWKQKDQDKVFNLKWSIESFAKPYCQNTKKCQLCLVECVKIIEARKSNAQLSLNKKNEIFGKCRHRRKVLLKYV
jgi:predicted GIY-YIG superfamily endonuclease